MPTPLDPLCTCGCPAEAHTTRPNPEATSYDTAEVRQECWTKSCPCDQYVPIETPKSHDFPTRYTPLGGRHDL